MFEKLHNFNATFDPRFRLEISWKRYDPVTPDGTQMEIFVAVYQNTPIGFATVVLKRDIPDWFSQREYAEISELWVDTPYRMMGIGKELIESCKRWVKSSSHVRDLRLYVSSKNRRAMQFYYGLGFRPIQEVWATELE